MSQLNPKFLGSGVNATKIANGSVSNTEFQYIGTLSSNAQDQLDAKVDDSEKGAVNGVAQLDANGFVPTTQIPPAAIERMVVVADQAARFALTTATVQNGDTVYQNDTQAMYFVIDDTNLGNASGYQIYSAGSSVNFTGSLAGEVTGTQGATVVGNAAVIGKVITGYVSAAGVVAATDSILQAIQKLNGNIAAIPGGVAGDYQSLTLVAGDIVNQYIDLAEEVKPNTLQVETGGVVQVQGVDYSLSTVALVTRITFLNDLATGGATQLVAGEILNCQYLF